MMFSENESATENYFTFPQMGRRRLTKTANLTDRFERDDKPANRWIDISAVTRPADDVLVKTKALRRIILYFYK